MSDQPKKSKPTDAYAVRKNGEKSYFTKIGVAFAHAKGGGFTVDLTAYPVGNTIVLFPPKSDAL